MAPSATERELVDQIEILSLAAHDLSERGDTFAWNLAVGFSAVDEWQCILFPAMEVRRHVFLAVVGGQTTFADIARAKKRLGLYGAGAEGIVFVEAP